MTDICLCEQGELRSERGQPGLSGKPFKKCCERFLSGSANATTPKQLMRSRYTAYALGNYGEYLLATWLPESSKGLTAAPLSEKSLEWVKLEVLNSDQNGDEGRVEFKAYYKTDDEELSILHEMSSFRRIARRWYYVEGDMEKQ
ncbi:MAG: SEC-C motif-containing protein [Gammaproteobacteria bacterium]|jgi:SEC-C motif-containing protein